MSARRDNADGGGAGAAPGGDSGPGSRPGPDRPAGPGSRQAPPARPGGERERGQIELASGRRLAYSDLGDPAGTPVLYCHGFPSSGLEAQLIDGEARRLKVRLLSPDRPGYGDSDPAPGRRIADFAADCEALAGWLRVATVGLIGVSGGAPYALACAERLGPRVSGLALVCPLGPIDLPETLGQMSWLTQSGFRLTRVAPALAEPLLAGPLPGLVAGLPQVLAAIRGLNTCPADREALRQGQATAILDRTIREALRQGAVGARQDLRLYTEPWGIDLAALALPIAVWHGGADRIVPPAHAHWYARHLQGAKLTLLPGEGHYSLPLRHAAAILERLVGLANP